MSEVTQKRLNAFMQWLPSRVAVRYHLNLEATIGSVLSAHLVVVSRPRIMHFCMELSRYAGARPSRPRISEFDSPRSVEESLRCVLLGWEESAQAQAPLGAWLEPEEFVGIVSRGNSPNSISCGPEAPVFGFYHGLLRERIFEMSQLVRQLAINVDHRFTGQASMLELLYGRFGSLVTVAQEKLEERVF